MAYDEIEISHTGVFARAAPVRGALVTALSIGGREVLYLDRATFDDGTKNVRGGIPVLFPYAGKLDNELFLAAGTTMKQHGFGRNKQWSVLERGSGRIRMGIVADDETRAVYPYEFSAEQTCTILATGLLVELLISNRDSKPLPVSPGWHPYFNCPAAQKPSVACDAPGFPSGATPNDSEFDFGIVAPSDGRAQSQVPGLGTMRLSFSPEMRHLQFWSQPQKDFICIEPFYGPNNTINTDRRCEIPPGASRVFWIKIEVF